MKVSTRPQSPLIPTTTTTMRRTKLALIGGAFGLFALAALGTALMLEGPKPVTADSTATTAVPAKVAANTRPGNSGPEHQARRGVPLESQPTPGTAPACGTCGVVESSLAIPQKGQGAGPGALAGTDIDKRQRASTVYQLKIRMADGSLRTVSQGKALPVGQRVHVDGEQITPTADNRGQSSTLQQTTDYS